MQEPITFPHQAAGHCAGPSSVGVCGSLIKNQTQAVAFSVPAIGEAKLDEVSSTITKNTGAGGETQNPAWVASGLAVRRLTPRECERLQGFPDDWTAIPYRKKPAEDCPDGPRYKALGNSMAVPCMLWIGERLAQVEAIQ